MPLDTLAAPASHLLEVKHSRFLARAVSVDDADAAMVALPALSDTAATHNCWAWRSGDQYRSSDDGEPAGTAGRPILAAIDAQRCDRVLVVVTRWYGGIKLGAGGLARAYGGAAAECLRLAGRIPLLEMAELEVHCAFDDLGSVHAALPSAQATRLDEHYTPEGAVLRLRLPVDQVDGLCAHLRDASRDRIHVARQA